MPTTTLQPWPTVRKGHQQRHPVSTLQYLLRFRGHNVVVDGVFGPKTDTAVRAFQQQRGVPVDGIVGPKTWEALITQVRKGDRGDAVRAVQEEFRVRSGEPSQAFVVDGIFGPNTDGAVRGFQEAVELESDGIVGPLTWRALVSGALLG